jgi:hypothetical protein
MGKVWRPTIIGLFILTFYSSGYAACDTDPRTCEPSIDDARIKIQQLLNSAFLTPYSLSEFEKLAGRGFETQGRKMYEMRFFAVVHYSGDELRCRTKLCPELHNYLVEVDTTSKKAKIAGWLFLEQDASGWR